MGFRCLFNAIAERLRPFEEQLTLLETIIGIKRRLVEGILTEPRTDMERFQGAPSSFMVRNVSWASPKRRQAFQLQDRKGSPWLRMALVEAESAAACSKGTYLGAYYQRLRKHMGHMKAIVVLAHRLLVIIYHLLNEQQSYRELGPGHAQEQANEASKRWAIRRLEQLGYQVLAICGGSLRCDTCQGLFSEEYLSGIVPNKH